ncbi:MAG: 3'(2'),5'-bisphosphate nucleotidase CysQ [Candidatus Cyclonatronum sp.]|uniref:3'(2'),5'-bisphosphate nucleotidase CysQ n=1 Tax=Cyclonatronum sp. TaxID=3024185 RepID=UPI0025C2F886|nr:3'(2'),5'-bisphosphate nucleotidase CysQ [Cyclonatronum sp.]MCH8488136.1 3'(2'),5'-bisphosphate nucleotidase CysQ [Cyclonatronum sp.]
MLEQIIEIAKKAGAAVLEEYHKPVPSDVDWKSDQSPLTVADRVSHAIIAKELGRLFPDIPLLSEEGAEIPYEARRYWRRFFCVDPVDGTKEFIKKTGHFTVNIALIEEGNPVLGVIYVPAERLLYYAARGKGAFKQEREEEPQQIRAHREYKKEWGLTVVASKDHAGPKVKRLFEEFPHAQTKSMGSSLKFCMVAEGIANLYLRDVPTYEWDTAAAQAIVEEAGGHVFTESGAPLMYNKEDLLNPGLITVGEGGKHWVGVIQGL